MDPPTAEMEPQASCGCEMMPAEASNATQTMHRVLEANASGEGASYPLLCTAPPAAGLTAPSALAASKAVPASESASETASVPAIVAGVSSKFLDSASSKSSDPLASPGSTPATGGFTAPLSRSRRASGGPGRGTGQPEADRVRRELAAESILGLWQSRCNEERTCGGAARESPLDHTTSPRCALK